MERLGHALKHAMYARYQHVSGIQQSYELLFGFCLILGLAMSMAEKYFALDAGA